MSEKDKITEIRNWAVADIWNAGFCDLSHYAAFDKALYELP